MLIQGTTDSSVDPVNPTTTTPTHIYPSFSTDFHVFTEEYPLAQIEVDVEYV